MTLQEHIEQSGMKTELVTYTLEVDGQWVVVEHVPALIDPITGEQFFTGETVDRLRETVRRQRPTRTVEAQVYEFAA